MKNQVEQSMLIYRVLYLIFKPLVGLWTVFLGLFLYLLLNLVTTMQNGAWTSGSTDGVCATVYLYNRVLEHFGIVILQQMFLI